MAAGQLAEHLLEEIIQVLAAGDPLEVGSVFLFRGREVEPVMVGVVEEVALDPPGLMEHLLPLDEGLDVDLHLAGLQDALPGSTGPAVAAIVHCGP